MAILKSLFGKKKKKAIVIGLDGVPFTLLKELISEGVTPNIASLASSGEAYFVQMDASIPEISSVSWSSFMTGVNPGQHGIYGFTDLKPGSYQMYFPSYPNLRTPTLWDTLGAAGKRSAVINLPGTYPARPHPGSLVAGFVAIDLKKAVHPPSLAPRLEGLGYRIDVDTARAAADADFLFRDLNETLDAREKAFEMIWGDEEWDLFVAVITGTDRLQHFQWESVADRGSKNHGRAMEFYSKADSTVGKIMGRAGSGDTVFIMSDHGFTGIETEVYINRWLLECGYLGWEKDTPEGIGDISPSSRAFGMDPSRIYIHSSGRYPKGRVDKDEPARLATEIASRARELEFGGRKVIREVYPGREIYSGPALEGAPDLVLLPNYGFDLKGNIRKKEVFGRSHFTGMHTRDDAFLISSAPLPPGRPHIEHLAGLVTASVLGA